MKIKTTITEIECSAEELRQSNTVSDSLLNVLRNSFNGAIPKTYEEEDDEQDV